MLAWNPLTNLLASAWMTAACAYMLARQSGWWLLLALADLPVSAALTALLGPRLQRLNAGALNAYSERIAVYAELLRAHQVVQAREAPQCDGYGSAIRLLRLKKRL